MKKIFFVANSEWYLKNFRESTINRFKSGYDTYCAFPYEKKNNDLDDVGAKICTFSMNPHGKNPFREFFSLFTVFYCFLKNRPDLVFSFNPKTNIYSLICCFFLKIPCVVNVSGVGVASELRGVVGRVYDFLCSKLYKRAKFVFFQNNEDYENYIRKNIVEEDKSCVLPGSGVNLNRYKQSCRVGKTSNFLMASRLIRQKGVEEYISAAQVMVDSGRTCKFYLAGVEDESSRAIDKKLLSSSSKKGVIEFLGHVRDMPSLLDEMDCVVLPSYYPEGTPKILIEAAASGKIIITTNTPGCREVVENGINGFFVKPMSISELSNCISKVNSLDEGEALAMQNRSREIAEERYSEDYVIMKYLEIAERVLQRKH
ncbi:glycosyltransferase family 4 protein [Halomonas sp. DP5N14-9]|uniref:glycosyltransferase family 4 protein n=1 Tax=Halomonas sp. DP5N14-9 TaxID=2859075 RepID=UPI001C99EDFC|nr:glycosyltransferase family 4 protein [Halomonas sp. DP5N14-9]MBY5941284.1 glycosyltransferase family 4 protein [Halomonas sp. DP5N14-9]